MLSVRLKRRSQPLTSPLASALLVIVPMLLALLLCAVLVRLGGADPWRAYRAMLVGAFGSLDSIVDVLMRATPLLLTGLGTAVAFRGGQWNIGGEGQIYFGALGATLVALALRGLPLWIHLPLTLAGAFVGGAMWALPAALLKAWRGVSEIITTLMLNYIAVFLIGYLVKGPLQGPSEFMALAIVIFGGWKPLMALAASLFFGVADSFQLSLQALGLKLPSELFLSLPYLLTIIAMALAWTRSAAPATLGTPYVKE